MNFDLKTEILKITTAYCERNGIAPPANHFRANELEAAHASLDDAERLLRARMASEPLWCDVRQHYCRCEFPRCDDWRDRELHYSDLERAREPVQQISNHSLREDER